MHLPCAFSLAFANPSAAFAIVAWHFAEPAAGAVIAAGVRSGQATAVQPALGARMTRLRARTANDRIGGLLNAGESGSTERHARRRVHTSDGGGCVNAFVFRRGARLRW